MSYGFKSFEVDASAFKPAVTAAELRLGNWLQSYTVWLIGNKSEKKITGPFQVDLKTLQMIYEQPLLVTMESIPLTDEILEKAMFNKYRYWWTRDGDTFNFEQWSHCGLGIYLHVNERKTGQHIKYLHQLQNLYFALTGSELEINL